MTPAEMKQIRTTVLKLTQQQLSRILEVSEGHIARLEMPSNTQHRIMPWLVRELLRLQKEAQP